MPAWSILIATLAYRQEKLLRLLNVLLPQAEAAGCVEVVALRNRGEWSIGKIRQALLEDARGEYVSFVDDDDLVESDFVPVVLKAIESRPDYVAFRHLYYENGVLDPHVTVTGLQYGGWYNTTTEYVRDVTHVNPVRTRTALKAGFSDQGSGEDSAYDARLRPLLHTQVEIDRVLYHYYHSYSDSIQYRLRAHARTPGPVVYSSAFRWHAWSMQ